MWQSILAVVYRATLGDWLLLAAGLLLLFYVAGTWKYDYFRKRGIPSTKPRIPFLGDVAAAFLGRRSFIDVLKKQYNDSDGHGVFGFFEFTNPIYLVRDPELLKVVAVKEFDKFMNHRAIQNEKSEPVFSKNLFNQLDQQWRDMRATMSPAFTTSKIKAMFPLISECAEQMAQHLREKCAERSEGKEEPFEVDMKDLFTRLTNDAIATAAFGVSCDSLKNPENEFYRLGKILTTFSTGRVLIVVGFLVFPKLMETLGLRILDGKSAGFFESLVHETVRERKKKNIFRPDLLQLLMQAQEGNLKEEKEDASEAENVGPKKKLTDDDLAAQAMVFFFAGFDTVSSALCVITYLLSHHEEVQRKLQVDIKEIMDKTDGKITYEDIQSMKYLDAVINECLRIYPPILATDRVCNEETMLPAGANSGSFTVRKGEVISIPIMGLHYDPQYWDEPEKFNPDRFSDENKHKIKPFTYMPFGLGPRICIGQRLALMEAKIVLVHLLDNFELRPSAKTKYPIEFMPGLNLTPRGGFWCELIPRDHR